MTVKITKPAINLREILSGIEPNATADQTPAEIKTAYESNSDTNAFTDSDKTKLDGIEQNATADQTGAEIKAAYEGEADTNAFTDTLLNKLNGIEANADVTDATNVTAAGAVMDDDFTTNGFMKRTGAGTYTIDASTYLTEGSALNDISDVTITGTPANNEILAYDTTAGAFINQTAAEAGVAALSGATFSGDVSLDNSRLLIADGTATAPAIGFTNDQDSGLYYSGGAFRVAFNGAQTFAFADGTAYSDDLLPSANETYALGGTLNRWNTFYTKDGNFSGTATLATVDINGGTIDGAVIGGSTPAAISGTTGSFSSGVYLGGTGAANLLDDYEEGTWTPTLQGNSTAGTYTGTLIGTYRKIGGFLYLFFEVRAASLTGHSGYIVLAGLPFSVSDGSGFVTYVEGGDFGYTAGTGNETLFLNASGNTAAFRPQNQNTAYDKYALTLTDGTVDHYIKGSLVCYL